MPDCLKMPRKNASCMYVAMWQRTTASERAFSAMHGVMVRTVYGSSRESDQWPRVNGWVRRGVQIHMLLHELLHHYRFMLSYASNSSVPEPQS